MNEMAIRIEKNLGETPREALERVRLLHPEWKFLPMTYAGRLDPMAEGELIILVGEECKKKDQYLGMDKEYEFEMLFGFETDSYDLLGLSESKNFNKDLLKENLNTELEMFTGKRIQTYPPYSSKTIDGIPLFKKTRDGEVFDMPTKEIEIYEIQFQGFREILGENLLKEIKRRIGLVHGDFRQDEIIETWEKNLSRREEEMFLIAKASMKCSSGTYVRAVVNDLSFPATTFSIQRTKIY